MNLAHALKSGSLVLLLAGCGAQAPEAVRPSAVLGDGNGEEECYKGEEFECAAEKEIARLNNEYRANSGRSELAVSSHMNWAARDWSKKQAARGSIGHDGFPGSRSAVYKAEFGSMEGVWIAGENVAYYGGGSGHDAAEAGRRLAQMWWNSSGHRANMLGNFSGLGVGVVRTRGGSVFGTQIFYRNAN
jgi:uncharacterized protein YkwD